MTAAHELPLHGSRAASWLNRLVLGVGETLRTLLRPPRAAIRLPMARAAVVALAIVALIVVSMVWLDQRAVEAARRLPGWLVHAFDEFTDFGKSGWFLYPTGALLVAIALICARPLPRFVHLTLAALTVRLGFIFLAVGLPGLLINGLKHVFGRARPFVNGDNVLTFVPFSWTAAYASAPSGHATTAFSAAIAIGALWPRQRPVMWTYAVLIGMSRVVITAHYPSDVLLGALIGGLTAILVRNWFAARRLGFMAAPDGAVLARPGPSWRRLKAVARRLASS